jgi:hypothetical protein
VHDVSGAFGTLAAWRGDGPTRAPPLDGTVDLALVDAATGAPPAMLATQVFETWFLSSDGKTPYYVAADGLHAAALE